VHLLPATVATIRRRVAGRRTLQPRGVLGAPPVDALPAIFDHSFAPNSVLIKGYRQGGSSIFGRWTGSTPSKSFRVQIRRVFGVASEARHRTPGQNRQRPNQLLGRLRVTGGGNAIHCAQRFLPLNLLRFEAIGTRDPWTRLGTKIVWLGNMYTITCRQGGRKWLLCGRHSDGGAEIGRMATLDWARIAGERNGRCRFLRRFFDWRGNQVRRIFGSSLA